MPDMDGEKLYHAVHELNPVLAKRIIFLTGDTISNAARSFLDWTGNRWFNKPFQIADLEKVVHNFLRADAELLSTVIR
jgi:two-component system NtrC family sensor kinase